MVHCGRVGRLMFAVAWVGLAACGGGGSTQTGDGGNTAEGPAPGDGATPVIPGGLVYGDLGAAALGAGATLNGALPFTADSDWNRDVSGEPVDPASEAILDAIGLDVGMHPDFGSGLWEDAPIGIPYVVVGAAQADVPIIFTDFADESDPGPYPIPADAPVEGARVDGTDFAGDRHVVVVDRDANRLYELYNAHPRPDGGWQASSGAVFHLDARLARPTAQPGWTSADAAGLPIVPGLVRFDEAHGGAIRHALRFTVARTRRAYLPPATHWASSRDDPTLPPMGMRVRLKAGFVIPEHFSTESRAILQALKTYGMYVADNGSNWYLSGAPDPGWDNDRLASELGTVRGRDFEVVQMVGLVRP
ncbi:MAG: hypothetical protein KDG55_06130 [Rhodocyclaceae bacterium]|nr:hypothetical protein [Rhodocyclaceae bacterium]